MLGYGFLGLYVVSPLRKDSGLSHFFWNFLELFSFRLDPGHVLGLIHTHFYFSPDPLPSPPNRCRRCVSASSS